ncbi:MAG: hypothetical protein PHV87_07800, partial [Bacilli bacterium]|nr:hypothetical protein [Bacilli bacterium]
VGFNSSGLVQPVMLQLLPGNSDKTIGIYSQPSNSSIVIREVKKCMTTYQNVVKHVPVHFADVLLTPKRVRDISVSTIITT